jgi:hypothetical protein
MRLPSYRLMSKLNTGTNDQIIRSELRMNQSIGTNFTHCLYCHVDCLIGITTRNYAESISNESKNMLDYINHNVTLKNSKFISKQFVSMLSVIAYVEV